MSQLREQTEDGGHGTYLVKFTPSLDIKKALAILGMIVGGHMDYLRMILLHRQAAGLPVDSPAWVRVQERLRILEGQVIKFSSISGEFLVDFDKLIKK